MFLSWFFLSAVALFASAAHANASLTFWFYTFYLFFPLFPLKRIPKVSWSNIHAKKITHFKNENVKFNLFFVSPSPPLLTIRNWILDFLKLQTSLFHFWESQTGLRGAKGQKRDPQTLFELFTHARSPSLFPLAPLTSLKQIKCQQISWSSPALLSPRL